MSAWIVFCTAPSPKEANRLAKLLVTERIAACVNVVPGVQSFFRWKGKVDSANELLLVIKTTRQRFPALRRRIEEIHSYDNPEILAIPVAEGNQSYLNWLSESVAPED